MISVTADRERSVRAPVSQTAPVNNMAAMEILVNLRKKRLPARNPNMARSQLAAIGIAAC
jgi:hypothetical protein